MNSWPTRLTRTLLVLWAGSLWAQAIWVAPLVFALAPDRHAAGVIAAGLFQVQTYLTAVLSALALLRFGPRRFRPMYLAAGLLLVNEFIIKKILEYIKVNGEVFGLGFGAWHALSAVFYVIACGAALLVVWNEDFRQPL